MLKGIDVSEHQGVISWTKVKHNVDFVMLRAGYGRNNIDKQFVRNIKECNRLGIKVGIYWFSYAYNVDMAKQEAKYALEAVKKYKIDYPICFDLEYDTVNYAKKNGVKITKRLATDMVKAFCDTIKDAGYKVMNYANPDFLKNYFYQKELNKYPLWLAYYDVKENQAKKYNCDIWQYTENGSIPGINGSSVDMNYSYKDFAATNTVASKPTTSNSNSNSGYKLIAQKGTCTVIVDTLTIREKPSTSSKAVGTYSKGQSVEYDYYVDNEGYRWISWIGASGKRRYMAVRVLATNKKYGNCV